MTVYVPTRPVGQALPPGTNLSPLALTAHVASEIPLTITGAAGQSSPFLFVQNSSGQLIFDVDSSGTIYLTPSAGYFINSAGAAYLQSYNLPNGTARIDANGNAVFYSAVINGTAGIFGLYISPSSSSTGQIIFQQGNASKWGIMQFAGSAPLQVYDGVNGRMHAAFTPGATAAAATTEFSSNLTVDGSTLQMNSTAGAIVAIFAGANSSGILQFASDGVGAAQWQISKNTGDPNLYFSDPIHGRQHMLFIPGTTNDTANVSFYSNATVVAPGSINMLNNAQSLNIFQVLNIPGGSSARIQTPNGYLQLQGQPGIGTTGVSIGQSAYFSVFNDTAISLQSACILLGLSAPALTATVGFPYIPATAGTPTGVPTAQVGYVPFRYDTTAHKLWIYDAGWKGVVVA